MGCIIRESFIYQYNKSTIILNNNSCGSSCKITRNIKIHYLFVSNRVKSKEASIDYCPTDDIIANFFKNTLQGSKFTKFRNLIMKIQY